MIIAGQSTAHFSRISVGLGLIFLALSTAACTTTGGYPPRADIAAATEAKPRPGVDILTDPSANDRYNSDIEAWGERVRAAGMRLCRFFERTGMPGIACPKEN